MYFSEYLKPENGIGLFGNITEDNLWNYITRINVNSQKEFVNVWNKSKILFNERNRIPHIYVTPTSNFYNKIDEIIPKTFSSAYIDAWMLIQDFSLINDIADSKNVIVQEIDVVKDKKAFVDTVMIAFGSTNAEDPYADLPQYYRKALNESFDNYWDSEYKVKNYWAKIDEKPISVATTIYKDDTAGIYNVGTIEEFRKKGISSSVIKYLVQDIRKLGVKNIFLQTSKDSYVERWYKKIGFNTIFIAKCFSEG